MLKYDTIDSSSTSNSDNLEDLKVTSYNFDEEKTSTDEEENIPKPMDTEQTDPCGKRKIESDLQKDDYLRSFNKDFEKVENTTRIFCNKTENIATNDVKPEYPGETSIQPIQQRIDDLNKRNVTQGGIYLEKTIDDWAQSMTIVVNNNNTWSKENSLNSQTEKEENNILIGIKKRSYSYISY
ncbi:hypothetical protein Gogos_008373 [Gossypium gossypioides]|uniref:Uncharacterized protein n=1 Tax=Gossypium gossypioides TaxID=34282 RepID=A0A7J9CC02_GOSGO|nr:hypothetical protein [Gossypium gossypioides]